jgi:PAS domain S-box-containing protein
MIEPKSKTLSMVKRQPLWFFAALAAVLIGWAVLTSTRDVGQERRYLEELYLHKGNNVIRSLAVAAYNLSREGPGSPGAAEGTLGPGTAERRTLVEEIASQMTEQEAQYLVLTDLSGRVVFSEVAISEEESSGAAGDSSGEGGGEPLSPESLGASFIPKVSGEISDPEAFFGSAFASPDLYDTFDFRSPPHWRVGTVARENILWVYKPLWFTFGPPPDQHGLPAFGPPPPPKHEHDERGKHRGERESGKGRDGDRHASDEESPRYMDPVNPAEARLCWVGFDMNPFQASEAEARINSFKYNGLIFLAGIVVLLAVFLLHNIINTRKLYQEEMALASAVFSKLPTGLIITDAEDKVTEVNPAALRISGIAYEDFKDKTLSSLTSNSFPSLALDEELMGKKLDLSFKEGNSPRLSITAGPVQNKEGNTIARVVLLTDVESEERLEKAEKEKKRLASLVSMAKGLAHEIGNPLGAIKGLTQHLLKRNFDESVERPLGVILESVERLEVTVSGFLDYTRPGEKLKPASVDLGKCLKDNCELISHDLKFAGVEIELKLPQEGDAIIIQGDAAYLSKAFMNLYINALQAVSANKKTRKIQVTLRKKDPGLARVTFRDNGPGFTEEQL